MVYDNADQILYILQVIPVIVSLKARIPSREVSQEYMIEKKKGLKIITINTAFVSPFM